MAEVRKEDLNIQPATGEALKNALSPSSSAKRQARPAKEEGGVKRILNGIIDGTIQDSAKTVEKTVLRPKLQQTIFDAGKTLLASLVFGSGSKAEAAARSNSSDYDKMYGRNAPNGGNKATRSENKRGYRDLEYDSWDQAKNALNELRNEAAAYNGVVTMAFYYEHNGVPSEVQYNKFGWYSNDLEGASIIAGDTGFTLQLPNPRYLS